MQEPNFDKFKTVVVDTLQQADDTPENVQLTADESKGILQGNSYAEKLRELESMMDGAPRKFRRKYRNPESSFSAKMRMIAQQKYK